jgi:predicted Zn-dependent protease
VYASRDLAATHLLARPESRAGLLTLYDQALAQNPDDWVLQRNIGMAYAGLGEAQRAKELLERAISVIPDDPDTLFALGTVDAQLGDHASAEKMFAEVRKWEPGYPALRRSTGEK